VTYDVRTRYPVASWSNDHLFPRGTKNDNSTNHEFNLRLREAKLGLMPSVLDLGCSGGGFVQSVLQMGAVAVGIEGSDFSKRSGRAAWSEIPDHLFTADIAKPFLVLWNGVVCRFEVVTMWEVLEHLTLAELEALMVNVHAHTYRDALFVCSVTSVQDRFEGVDYHATLQPPAWWIDFFESHGWANRPDLHDAIAPHWVRGPNTEGPASTCFVFEKR
jgi:cyclopropane fatty-acyl-phospholipid synthase-like methyltransferase